MIKKTVDRLDWAPNEQKTKALSIINNKKWSIYYKLNALDKLFETFGVEAVYYNDDNVAFEYLNTGETYTNTIIYRWDLRRFQVASWGDIVELLERKGYKLK